MRLLFSLLAVAALTISVGCAPPADDTPAPTAAPTPVAPAVDVDADGDADAPADTDSSAVSPAGNLQLVSLELPAMV